MPKVVFSKDAPAPVGPYAQGIAYQGLLHCSGQLGLDPASGTLAEGVEEQARRSLANLEAVLKAAGTSREKVLRCTLYLVDMRDFATVNAIYADFFGEWRPARTCVQIAALPKGGLVEVDALAAL
jgi:2-iminobutanoate/2-iminopropanoate deaminase